MTDVDVQLGQKVRDEISGFTGIVTTIGDHITGCTRIGVHPSGEEETTNRGSEEFFFDPQLTIVEEETEFAEYGENALTDVEFELGERVRDTVTEFEGVAVVINYSLFNCPSIAVEATDVDADENIDLEWFDAPRLNSVDEGITGEFADLQQSDAVEATGPVQDSAPPRDKP